MNPPPVPVAPAEGERRAMRGYLPQYTLAAVLVLDALRANDLDAMRVADPKAGRVDDAQVLRAGRADAYQVKWEKFDVGTITFRGFLTAGDDGPSLVRQLADGLKTLRQLHPNRTCNVHLFTCNQPSKADNAIGDAPDGTSAADASFAAFRSRVWQAVRQHGRADVIPPEWRLAWQRFCDAAGLTADAAVDFVRHCHLDLGRSLPKLYPEWDQPDAEWRPPSEVEDLRNVYGLLQDAVADDRGLVEISRATLLQRLGWERRFGMRHRHEFPQPPAYAANRPTEAALARWLDEHDQGYLALVGSPGSGKSTLGSRVLVTSGERRLKVVRYLAFVPDGSTNAGRGESADWFADVNHQLNALGHHTKEALATDPTGLRRQFYERLRSCGETYERDGARTLIHVDGLDHIPREYSPDRSLLKDLPLPGDLPRGVIVVLGTQRVDLDDLPFGVRQAIGDEGGQVQVTPLGGDAVGRLLEQSPLPVPLTPQQRLRAAEATEGHPLSVSYLLRELRECATAEAADAAIKAASDYGGEVERRYAAAWEREITRESGRGVADALGLACRLRRGFRLEWLARAVGNEDAVLRLRDSLRHLFVEEPDGSWHFFHNSFRLFLQARTAAAGLLGPAEKNAQYHRRLAAACATSQPNERERWEHSYHASAAGDAAAVVEQVTPEALSSQLAAFRPAQDIVGDCRLLFDVAVDRQDPVLLCRAVLLATEYASRVEHLDDVEWLETLVEVGEAAALGWHLREGRGLSVSSTAALGLSARLHDTGHVAEAGRLFEIASDQVLVGHERPPFRTGRSTIAFKEWSAAAARMLPAGEALDWIARLEDFGDEREQVTDEQATEETRDHMRQWLAVRLAQLGRWDECRLVTDESCLGGEPWWLEARVRVWEEAEVRLREGDPRLNRAQVEAFAGAVISTAWPVDPEPALAARLYRVLGGRTVAEADWARAVLARVRQQAPEEIARQYERNLGHVIDGETTYAAAWAEVVAPRVTPPLLDRDPRATQSHLKGLELFVVACRDLGTLAGLGRAGLYLTPEEIERRVVPLLRLFNRPWRETREPGWISWFQAQEHKGEFLSGVIHAASRHGASAVTQVRKLCESDWADPNQNRWGSDAKRKVLLAFASVGHDDCWAAEQLRSLEEGFAAGADVTERVGSWSSQAAAFAELHRLTGRAEYQAEARRALRAMVRTSYGVGFRKDYQSEEWVGWLRTANKSEPAAAAKRIAWFAAALCSEDETTEGRGSADAAEALVAAAWEHHPEAAVELLHYFHERGLGWFPGLFERLLKAASADAPSSPLLFDIVTDLFFSITSRASPELLDSVLGQPADRQKADQAAERALTLAHSEARRGWTTALQKRGVAIDADDLPTEEPYAEEQARLADGPSTEGEQDRFVRRLRSDDEAEADAAWDDAPLVTRTAEGAINLAGALPDSSTSAAALAAISRRLICLGERGAARQVAERAVRCCEMSDEYSSWGRSHRLALDAYQGADGPADRARAWQVFRRVTASGRLWPSSTALKLRDALPALCADVPWAVLWTEVERHLASLFAEPPLPAPAPVLPENTREPPQADEANFCIALLLVRLLTHPAKTVARAARRVFADAVSRGDPGVSAGVRRGLKSDEETQLATLQIIDAARLRRAGCVEDYAQELDPLAISPSLQVRVLASNLAADLGAEPQSSPGTVAHPDAGRLRGAIVGLVVPADAEVAQRARRDLLIFEPEIELLARRAGVDAETLFLAAAAVMDALPNAPAWDAKSEDILRRRLQSHGPTLPYIRPRARAARLAVSRVAAALADAGLLGGDTPALYEMCLQHHDPHLLAARPSRKPRLTLGPKPDHNAVERWLDSAGEALPLLSGRIDDYWVVAESTVVDHLHGDGAEEVRAQCVWATDAADAMHALFVREPQTRVFLFESLSGWPGDLVLRTSVPPGEKRLRLGATMMSNRWRDTLGSGIVVPAPHLLERLGWRRRDVLHYEDASGEAVARTVFWQTGQRGIGGSHRGCQAANGSLLLTGPLGERQVRAAFPSLARIKWAERSESSLQLPVSTELTVETA